MTWEGQKLAAEPGRYLTIDRYPGFEHAPDFLRGAIASLDAKSVADIGGGANPMLDLKFIRERHLEYHVLDISERELGKAFADYSKLTVDMCAPASEFDARVSRNSYDLVFTHNFLEHIAQPEAVHRNIRSMLKQGGMAIHMFPCSSNVPLALNKHLPEGITRALVRIAQPKRDVAGKESKFKAYYELCGAPSQRREKIYEGFGFDVVVYKGFIGHGYYERVPLLRDVERALRKPLASLNISLVSNALLILRKRTHDSDASRIGQTVAACS